MIQYLKENGKLIPWLMLLPAWYLKDHGAPTFGVFLDVYEKMSFLFLAMFLMILLNNIKTLRSKSVKIFSDTTTIMAGVYELLIFGEAVINHLSTLDINAYIILLSVATCVLLITFIMYIALHINDMTDISICSNNLYFSHKEEKRTIVHEAGHLVFYGLLEKFPEIKVEIVDNSRAFFIKDYLGYVEHSLFSDVRTKENLEWEMKMVLGGKQLEEYVLGGVSVGASEDMELWNTLAIEYLEEGFGDVYYHNPKDDEQIKSNNITLSRLKRNQEEQVIDFFIANDSAVKELIALVEKQRVLHNKDVEAHLKQVESTFNSPKISYS